MYQVHGLLMPGSTFTLGALADKLRAQFSSMDVEEENGELTLFNNDWQMFFKIHSGPEVLEDSKTVEEKIAGRDFEKDISICDRRVEGWSDIPDPEMDHFQDFQSVIEVLKSFPGLVAIDPTEPALF